MNTEKIIQLAFAGVIILLAFGYLFAVTFLNIPDTGADHSKTIVGFLLGVGLTTLINYYWGSSKGSRDQSEATQKRLDPCPPEKK